MIRKYISDFVMKKLDHLYPSIDPFLFFNDPYNLLIAIMLSANSRDIVVKKVCNKLFSIASNPYDMIQLDRYVIKNIIREIGMYNKKTSNILAISNILIDKYNGIVPDNMEELKKFPGVGHKTAGVVLSQYFKQYYFPVDTHIFRLMKLWRLSNGKNVYQVEKDAMNIFPKEKWHKLHLQIIKYGREYSPSRGYNLDKDEITKFIMHHYH